MDYQFIETPSQLNTLCEHLQAVRPLAVDTEFMRRRSYYPHPGLLQLGDGDGVWLVDPLCCGDLQPLWELLFRDEQPLVMHASGEDLQLFHAQSGLLPRQLADTQLAAAFLDQGMSCGLATLLERYLGILLQKTQTCSDWLARPLSSEQLEYATLDVAYLLPLYERLLEALGDHGVLDWYQEECLSLQQRAVKQVVPDEAYRDIKLAWQLKPQQLVVLQKLAAWRIETAQQQDLAINFVVKEDVLWAIAQSMPDSLQALRNLSIHPMEFRRYGEQLLALVDEALQTPSDQWPEPIARLIDYPNYQRESKRIRTMAKAIAVKNRVAPELLASNRLINEYLSWLWKKGAPKTHLPQLLTGWRRSLLETLMPE